MQHAPTEEAVLQAAGEALARGAWSDAYDVLLDADRSHRLETRQAITMLAQAAYLAGSIEAATQAFERIHTAALAADDRDAAADAAVQISFLLFDAVMYAPSRAWLRRAERLIEGRPDSRTRPGTLIMRSWHALVTGDYETTIRLAREAVGLAERLGDRDGAAIARLAEGRALIAQGGLDDGLTALDEASVAAVSGELSPPVAGAVYCMANCAFQSVSDYERAEQWTQSMERWSASAGLTTFQGRCRLHRAQLKRLHGDWRGAAAECTKAGEELGSAVPAERGWALTELGLIRLRTGDLEAADALFTEAYELGWEPQPGMSLLRLAQGDVTGAEAAIADALDRAASIASREVPPQGALRRAPLLAAQVEISIAAGDAMTADAAVEELETIAATYGTPALIATASGARGTVLLAAGDHEGAMRKLQSAVATWQALDAPYEIARTRARIAEAAAAAGNGERAALEYRAAISGFERLDAVLDARRTSQAATPVMRGRAAARRTRRETRTFMFTDIVKSTNLLAAIGDEAWQHLLRWHNQTLVSLIERHGGTVVDRTGDGFFAAFERESDAVEAAVGIQRALVEHRRRAGFAPNVRVGLHAAVADTDGRNWTGIGVHAAARVGALAEGDQIVASRATVQDLGSRYPISDPREVSLKGISEPFDVVTVDWRSGFGEPPA